MTIYVIRKDHPNANENGFVTKEEALEWDYFHSEDKRAVIGNEVVSMNFISDTMDLTRHMVTGKNYTSKAAFRAATKKAGCIEYGNETKYLTKPREIVMPDRRQRRDDIRKSIHQLKNRNSP